MWSLGCGGICFWMSLPVVGDRSLDPALLCCLSPRLPPFLWVGGWCVLGGVLLFRVLAGAVPLALGVLASGFGMGPGVASPL